MIFLFYIDFYFSFMTLFYEDKALHIKIIVIKNIINVCLALSSIFSQQMV